MSGPAHMSSLDLTKSGGWLGMNEGGNVLQNHAPAKPDLLCQVYPYSVWVLARTLVTSKAV